MNAFRAASLRASRQAGLSLVVALIMLVIMTATTLTVFRMSFTGSQIVGNMQFAEEALASADSTIQEALTTRLMFLSPTQVFLEECKGSFNNRCVDIDGDETDDIVVSLDPPPVCTQVTIVPVSALNLADPAQLACTRDTAQIFGVEGATNANSLCADSTWEIRANARDFADDEVTGARATVVEGVGVQVSSAVAVAFCSPPPPPPPP